MTQTNCPGFVFLLTALKPTVLASSFCSQRSNQLPWLCLFAHSTQTNCLGFVFLLTALKPVALALSFSHIAKTNGKSAVHPGNSA
jgi:hypothetical protein